MHQIRVCLLGPQLQQAVFCSVVDLVASFRASSFNAAGLFSQGSSGSSSQSRSIDLMHTGATPRKPAAVLVSKQSDEMPMITSEI